MSVKPRLDGKGTIFNNSHRLLPNNYYMSDIDEIHFTINTPENTFFEYRLVEGKIKFVAIFEKKECISKEGIRRIHASSEHATHFIGTANGMALLEMARLLQCRLFLVYEDNQLARIVFFEYLFDEKRLNNTGFIDFQNDDEKAKQDKIQMFYSGILGI